jgi:hypothetical protein
MGEWLRVRPMKNATNAAKKETVMMTRIKLPRFFIQILLCD